LVDRENWLVAAVDDELTPYYFFLTFSRQCLLLLLCLVRLFS